MDNNLGSAFSSPPVTRRFGLQFRHWPARALRLAFHARGDRGQERYRRASLTASMAVVQRGLTILITIASVPLTLHYLGPERYGIWLTISSLLLWLALTDGGVTGNALVNALSEANGRDDRTRAREYVSSAVWAMCLVSAVLATAALLLFPHIPWNAVFHSSSVPHNELRLTCALVFAFFVTGLPLNVQSSIFSAYQHGYLSNLWGIVINVVSFAALVVVTRFRGGLPQLVLALSSARFIVNIGISVYIFKYRYPWLLPRLSAVRWRCVLRLANLGNKYILNQLGAFGMYQSQPLLITQFLGPSEVTIFVIAQRLMSMPMELAYMLTAPLVPAFGEARARGDWQWIRQTYKRGTTILLLGELPLLLLLTIAARDLIRIWAGPAAVPDFSLIVWFAVCNAVIVALMCTGQFLMGVERLWELTVSTMACALLNVGLGVALCSRMGVQGFAIAIATSTLTVYWPLQVLAVRKLLTLRASQAAALETTENTA